MLPALDRKGLNNRKMKAASLVFERVLLFGVGVIIFIACYAIFMGYQDYFIEVSLEDQLTDVGNHITTSIIRVAERNVSETRLSIKIPPRVGNEPYFIELSRTGLKIMTTVTSQTRSFRVYGLNESFLLEGESVLSTDASELLIYKKGNRIILL